MTSMIPHLDYPLLPPDWHPPETLFNPDEPSRGLPIPPGWEVIPLSESVPTGAIGWHVRSQVDIRDWRQKFSGGGSFRAQGHPGWVATAIASKSRSLSTVYLRPSKDHYKELEEVTDEWGLMPKEAGKDRG